MTLQAYPSFLARLLGERRTTNGCQTLSWCGQTWVRVGAVWIPANHFGSTK